MELLNKKETQEIVNHLNEASGLFYAYLRLKEDARESKKKNDVMKVAVAEAGMRMLDSHFYNIMEALVTKYNLVKEGKCINLPIVLESEESLRLKV